MALNMESVLLLCGSKAYSGFKNRWKSDLLFFLYIPIYSFYIKLHWSFTYDYIQYLKIIFDLELMNCLFLLNSSIFKNQFKI